MAGKAVAIDVGTHTIKALQMRTGKRGIEVTRFCAVPAAEGPDALAERRLGLKGAVCGLSGRDMTLRYSQVPPTPDWQLKNLMDLEIQDLAQQSGGALSADYNLLPPQDEEAGVDTVLLALARDESIDRLQAEVRKTGGTAEGFTPNCVAIYNAYLKAGPVEQDAVVCLCNVGHETIDIALVKGIDLLFARNLSGGGKVLDDAIATAFNVSGRKAETLKRDLLDLDPQSRGKFASGQAEKVTMAAGGAANAIVAGIQSSLAFCKAQTKIADLRLDKVLVCGGSARLRGLRGMLREALRCPVELFDPFANLDLSALPEDEAAQLQAMRHEAVVLFGLAAARVDDTLYALEIVPPAVRRRKRFSEQTIFNIAAVAIAVGLLLMFARQRRTELAEADSALSRVQSQQRIARSFHDATVQQLENNQRDRALLEHLGSLAAPLHGAVSTGQALLEHMPQQLWLKKFTVAQKTPPGVRSGSRIPVVEFEGAGKGIDGVDVGQVFLDFSRKFRADARIPKEPDRVKTTTPAVSSDSNLQFIFTIDWSPVRAVATEGGQ